MVRPLTEEEADAAGRGVDEGRLAGAKRVGAFEQVLRRQPLQEHGGGGLVVHPLGQAHQAFRGHHAPVAVRARRQARRCAAVDDAIPWRQVGDPGADFLHDAGRLHAKRHRQPGPRVAAGAVVNVGEVDADGRVAQQRLAGAGVRHLDSLDTELLGASGLVDANGDRRGHDDSSAV